MYHRNHLSTTAHSRHYYRREPILKVKTESKLNGRHWSRSLRLCLSLSLSLSPSFFPSSTLPPHILPPPVHAVRTLSTAVGSAPYFSRHSTASTRLCSAAMCSALSPLWQAPQEGIHHHIHAYISYCTCRVKCCNLPSSAIALIQRQLTPCITCYRTGNAQNWMMHLHATELYIYPCRMMQQLQVQEELQQVQDKHTQGSTVTWI